MEILRSKYLGCRLQNGGQRGSEVVRRWSKLCETINILGNLLYIGRRLLLYKLILKLTIQDGE